MRIALEAIFLTVWSSGNRTLRNGDILWLLLLLLLLWLCCGDDDEDVKWR